MLLVRCVGIIQVTVSVKGWGFWLWLRIESYKGQVTVMAIGSGQMSETIHFRPGGK